MKKIVVIVADKLRQFKTSSDVAAHELHHLGACAGVSIVNNAWLFDKNASADLILVWEFESVTMEGYEALIRMSEKIPVFLQTGDWEFMFDPEHKKDVSSLVVELARKAVSLPCRYTSYAEEHMPENKEKIWYFPHSYGSAKRAFDSESTERTKKVLVGGQVGHGFYPERVILKKMARYNKSIMTYAYHPTDREVGLRKGEKCYSGDYSKLIGSHFAAVATPSKYNFLLRKYFEIPAMGTLLIAINCPDLEKNTPLRKDKHYFEVTVDDFLEKSKWACAFTEQYEEMRISARDIVRKNYSSEAIADKMICKIREYLK